MAKVVIARRVEDLRQRLLVRQRLRSDGEDGAHGVGHDPFSTSL